jgi:hypothetical protein
MSWKAGSGFIIIAPSYTRSTNEDTVNEVLLAGQHILVVDTEFKLTATKG